MDIVCWDGHTAMYAGDSKIIHAQCHDTDICITKVSSSHKFLGVLRYKGIGNDGTTPSGGITTRSDSGGNGNGISEKRRKKLLKQARLTPKKAKELKAIFDLLTSLKGKNKVTPAVVAGMMACCQQESGNNPFKVEGGSGSLGMHGIGAFQWTEESEKKRASDWFKSHCKSEKHELKEVYGWQLCTKLSCQYLYSVSSDGNRGDWINHAKNWNKAYNSVKKYINDAKGTIKTSYDHMEKTKDGGSDWIFTSKYDGKFKFSDMPSNINTYDSADEFYKNETNPIVAANIYVANHLRGANCNLMINFKPDRRYDAGHYTDTDWWLWLQGLRSRFAEPIYELMTGMKSDGTSAGIDKTAPDLTTAQEAGKGAYVYGLIDEKEYVTYQKMEEAYVDLWSRNDLSDDELYNIEMWEEDVESTDLQTIIIDASRWFVMLLGILIIIWMLVIYLCYWLDAVNNFVDIEFLPAVTFKRLRRAELEEDVTWHLKGDEVEKGKPKTIDHKRLLLVVILGIILGALIVSGKLFDWVSDIFLWVIRFIGSIFE